MGILIMAGQLMLSLSILVVLHELGHFIPAKLFKTRVEKFYLFFDPWFSLFKTKRGETEYGIGWLPFGGYVKIAGMIDESFDKEQMKGEPQPWEFRSKKAWQRLIIMLGGVTVNFILGFLIFAFMLFIYGEEYLPAQNAKYGIAVDSLGMELGLKDGDKILAIGDKPFDRFSDRMLIKEVVFDDAKTIKILRDGQEMNLPIDEKFSQVFSSSKNKDAVIFTPRFPFVAGKVLEDSPAEKAGLQIDDKIIALNGQPTPYFNDFLHEVTKHKSEEVTVTIERDGQKTDLKMTTTEEGKIGVRAYGFDYFFDTERIKYSLAEAIPKGVTDGFGFITGQIKAFRQMFRGRIKATESLGSFVSIGKMFGDHWIWERFWRMTAILSLILGFINLLPIPALDGGHAMFVLFEMITGKKPSDKFIEYATMAGFVLLIGLMVFALGLDIKRLF